MADEAKSKKCTKLTNRQKDILGLMAKGATNNTVALELGISIYTVKYHKRTIFKCLGVVSSNQAIAAAMSLKLI